MRFQTRLSLAMSLLIAVAIGAMAVVVLWVAATMIIEQYFRVGVTVTKLATRNIGYGAAIPDRVTDRVGEQMVVSALLLSELIAVAERDAHLPPDRIGEILQDVVERSAKPRGYPLVTDLWVTDETGLIYLGAEPLTGFRFSPDPAVHPQSHEFYRLLAPGNEPIIQQFQPRDKDGLRFKYVGVSGTDKPRIVQVGAGEQLIDGIQNEFSVQNVVDRFFIDLNCTRMMVVDIDGNVIAAAGRPDVPAEDLRDPEVVEFCREFLLNTNSVFNATAFGLELAVVTRMPGAAGEPERALFIQHRTSEGIRLVKGALSYVLALSVITLLSAVFMTFVLTRRFSKPIRELAVAAREFSTGNLGYRARIHTRDEMQSLAKSFNAMADSLQVRMRELEAETRRRERLESELAIAAEVQRSLLPEAPPRIEGLELAGWSQPAREVGGDFYDFIVLGPNRVGVAIGDATGKGLSAAMLITECWSALGAVARDAESPAELLARTNAALCGKVGDSGRFVTLFFMVVDVKEGLLRYAQGGHNPPILVCEGRSGRRLLECASGMPLGVDPGCRYEDHTIQLAPGDTILLYSDGLTEARGRDGELYGEARLCRRLDEVIHLPVERLLEAVRHDVERFLNGLELTDDVTIAVARFSPPHSSAAQP